MNEYIPYILPALITIAGNIVFYFSVKKRIDNSIEKFKISYSGVFREKIDLYKSLLEQVHDLKLKINQFQYLNEPGFDDEIRSSLNKLIRSYMIARPFLSMRLLSLFQTLTLDLQAIYEAIARGNIHNLGDLPPNEQEIVAKAYREGVSKLRDGKTLNEIESNILSEMRSELQTT